MWEPVANDSNGHHFHNELIKTSRHRHANYLRLERFRFDNQLINESQGHNFFFLFEKPLK